MVVPCVVWPEIYKKVRNLQCILDGEGVEVVYDKGTVGKSGKQFNKGACSIVWNKMKCCYWIIINRIQYDFV